MTAALAATHAWFPPGERLAYQTNTFGHLVGELIHRATGDMPGERLRRLADPLEADVWFGVSEAEQASRADIIWAPTHETTTLSPFAGLAGDVIKAATSQLTPTDYTAKG